VELHRLAVATVISHELLHDAVLEAAIVGRVALAGELRRSVDAGVGKDRDRGGGALQQSRDGPQLGLVWVSGVVGDRRLGGADGERSKTALDLPRGRQRRLPFGGSGVRVRRAGLFKSIKSKIN
jgi:hypothetical protein